MGQEKVVEKVDVQAIEQKVTAFKNAVHEKLFAEYTSEQVDAAVDVAVAVMPRLKNYFTKIEKSFRLITQPAKTQIVIKLTRYSLEHPDVTVASLSYSLKQAAGVKVIPDEQINKLLDEGDFPIVVAQRGTRSPRELDFTI